MKASSLNLSLQKFPAEKRRFLYILHDALERQLYHDTLKWSQNGKYFIIPDVPLFTQRVLPSLFTHQNYSSFVRQLHMYSFKKSKQDGYSYCYYNPSFGRGRRDLLSVIERRKGYKSAVDTQKPQSQSQSQPHHQEEGKDHFLFDQQRATEMNLRRDESFISQYEEYLLNELKDSQATIEDLHSQNMYLRMQLNKLSYFANQLPVTNEVALSYKPNTFNLPSEYQGQEQSSDYFLHDGDIY